MENKKIVTDNSDIKMSNSSIEELSKILAWKIGKDEFKKSCAPAAAVLKLVGLGAFLVGSIAVPGLPIALKPFIKNRTDPEAWKRFNIPYLKRTLTRLEKQKLVSMRVEGTTQIVEITNAGKRKILKYGIEESDIEKPRIWDGYWRMVSYDIPQKQKRVRETFRSYLDCWGFYPFQESVFLHAYPCQKQIEFLREYLGIGQYVRILKVDKIENDGLFRDFFGI